jgi:multidrug efflux pump subunit AcrB
LNKHPLDRLVSYALGSKLPLVLFIFALLAGAWALNFTAREEEPQIVVPMLDVWVEVPNLSARQVERQVTLPLEKLLNQIPGVEHIYSTSVDGRLSVTLRFYVGENREVALLNTYNKLYSNQDMIPSVVSNWMLKPIEVDDVPILMLGLYSTDAQLYGDYELRRVADEISTQLQAISNTSEVQIVGGRQRRIQLLLDPQALAGRQTTVLDVYQAVTGANELKQTTSMILSQQAIFIESGYVLRDLDALNNIVVNMVNGKAVLLKDVATLQDGPQEVKAYQWLEFNQQSPLNKVSGQTSTNPAYPMVTISIAKQKGSNAVSVASQVLSKIRELETSFLPTEMKVKVLRNYGETADEKVTNLMSSLAFAVFTVVIFISIFLGWRSAVVVGLAVPVCYGLTLLLDLMFGYTINRVTLFALILSLGLLVDDPITGIDNISRFLSKDKSYETAGSSKSQRIINAIAEIRTPLVMSTLTIVLAFVPLAFITGMMGPYMAPMAFNVPATVIISTFVAFLITPWLAARLLKPTEQNDKPDSSVYSKIIGPFIANKSRAKLTLWTVLLLFIASAALPVLRSVPLKLLPFDNKNELQVLIDMPESATLEQTAAMTKSVLQLVKQLPEVKALAAYVGEPSPIDFNGMVRQYYRRAMPNLAEVRVVLVDKTQRQHQSHGVVLRLREMLRPLQGKDISLKVVEVPPGPPVLSTLVAEVYAEPFVSQEVHIAAALSVKQRLQQEAHVVEVDSSLTSRQALLRFVVDKQKAALSGISTKDINQTVSLGMSGMLAGNFQQAYEANPVAIELKLPYSQRNSLSNIEELEVKGQLGVALQDAGFGLEPAPQPLVSLAELGQWQHHLVSQPILHKDLRPVIYVSAELSGRTPAEVIADISYDKTTANEDVAGDETKWQTRTYLNSGAGISWTLPPGTEVSFSGEGEWSITIDVFRDMGIAFAFALLAIFVVLRLQTQSMALSLIIMSAIPLTIIGIMPGFWLMNQFGETSIGGAPDPVLFTATAMIGMIALAGIVVRNSLILVEFISQARALGKPIKEALILAGTVRTRPVLLTAGTTLLGNLVIILDPVFSGLALAIIFGIIASTALSLLVVPVVYFLVFNETNNNESTQETF